MPPITARASRMRRHRRPLALAAALVILATLAVSAQQVFAESPEAQTACWTQEATSENPATAAAAIAHLRKLGPAGLQALYRAYGPAKTTQPQPDAPLGATAIHTGYLAQPQPDSAWRDGFYRPNDPIWPRLTHALDQVGGQYDNYSSRLFWYTDLDAAKAAAIVQHKPILSLRLLGKLTDEFTCANSRFFRAVLYTDPQVQAMLRENFVLYWESVRPVPVVTIDMGDGRILKRTVTGNSIHYVLDENGRVIDGIPGLYAPQAFLTMLQQAHAFATTVADHQTEDFDRQLAHYHAACLRRIAAQALRDLPKSTDTAAPAPGSTAATAVALNQAVPAANPPLAIDALTAAKVTPSKGLVETPALNVAVLQAQLLAAIEPPATPPPVNSVRPSAFTPTYIGANGAVALAVTKMVTERELVDLLMPKTLADAQTRLAALQLNWQTLAQAHRAEAALAPATLAYIRALDPCATGECALPTITATANNYATREQHFAQTMEKFQTSLAEDTVRNEYSFHVKIHTWLQQAAAGRVTVNLQEFNEKIYAELFLTPGSDPWLGLIPPDTFSALPRDGLVK